MGNHFTILHEDTSKPNSRGITYTKKPFVPSGKVYTEADVILYFNSWNIFSQAPVHSNLAFFWVKVVNKEAIDKKLQQISYINQPNPIIF